MATAVQIEIGTLQPPLEAEEEGLFILDRGHDKHRQPAPFSGQRIRQELIAQNGGMYQQMLMMQQQMLAMAQIVDKHEGSNLSEQIARRFLGGSPGAQTSSNMNSDARAKETEALGGEAKESSTTKKARERVAESTDPT